MDIKAGYRTTEFWVTLAAVVFFAYVGVPDSATPKQKLIAVIAALFAALGYGGLRTLQKSNGKAPEAPQDARPEDAAPKGFANARALRWVFFGGLVALAVASTSCALVKQETSFAGQCIAQVVGDAKAGGVVQLQPVIDAALHTDWAVCVSTLEGLAAKYGEEFVACEVQKHRDQSVQALTAVAQQGQGPLSDSIINAHVNASRFLLTRAPKGAP